MIAGIRPLRSAIVCDASVLAALVFGESQSDRALVLLRSRRLLAPALLRHELAQIAVSKLNRRAQDALLIEAAFAESLRVPLRTIAPSWPEVVQLAREHNLSAYDASYLQVALALDVPLATFDARLAEVARALGVLADPTEA